MSIIGHMLYDPAQAEAYRQEAESIVRDATGETQEAARRAGKSRQYQMPSSPWCGA